MTGAPCSHNNTQVPTALLLLSSFRRNTVNVKPGHGPCNKGNTLWGEQGTVLWSKSSLLHASLL